MMGWLVHLILNPRFVGWACELPWHGWWEAHVESRALVWDYEHHPHEWQS